MNLAVPAGEECGKVGTQKERIRPGKTDEEYSLVCATGDVPPNVVERDDRWRGFRIQGMLDFPLIGILAGIAETLAGNGISIFAISTYNTDYVLVKKERYQRALDILERAGYEIVERRHRLLLGSVFVVRLPLT
ncbi:amino acid-binding protein [Collinsella sp. An307]|nr:amino acid-binding protein [Collinsella sp. An307]